MFAHGAPGGVQRDIHLVGHWSRTAVPTTPHSTYSPTQISISSLLQSDCGPPQFDLRLYVPPADWNVVYRSGHMYTEALQRCTEAAEAYVNMLDNSFTDSMRQSAVELWSSYGLTPVKVTPLTSHPDHPARSLPTIDKSTRND